MQFRQRGNKIQVYKYAGYDTEQKRAKMEFLGSMDLEGWPGHKLATRMSSLSEEEQAELKAYQKQFEESYHQEKGENILQNLSVTLMKANDALKNNGGEIAGQEWEEWSEGVKFWLHRVGETIKRIERHRQTTDAPAS